MPPAEGHIVQWYLLSPADLDLARKKRSNANRLGFAVLLLFFHGHGRFPRAPSEIDPKIVADVAQQLGIDATANAALVLTDRTTERHRAEVRALLGFREAIVADAEALADWLRDHAVAESREADQLTVALEERCRTLRIEPPAADRIERIIRAAIRGYDERFCAGSE
jgi:hypothetical protein